MKKFKILAVALAAAVTLTACGGGNAPSGSEGNDNGENAKVASTDYRTPEGNRIKTNNNTEPASLDPAKGQGTHESWILQHLNEGLMGIDKDGQIIPALAEKYDVSEDGLTYTFTLKDGLKWSNGDPLTAHDFEFSWKRVLDPNTQSEYAYQLYYVKGGEEFNNGKGSIDDVAIKALDDKTLKVELKEPTVYFPGLTAFYTLYPVEEKLVKSNPKWDTKPETYASSGAFKLTEWSHSAKIVLDKNPNYYDADKIKIDGIDLDIIEEASTAWQKYEAGEYNVDVSIPTQMTAKLLAENDPQLHIGKDIGIYYYNFNTTKKPFTNQKIRQAFSLALDRKVIAEKITKGGQIPAYGIIPPGMKDDEGKEFREYQQELFKDDPVKAKELLEEGLKEEGWTMDDLKGITVLYNTDENHKNIAQACQNMWKQTLGVEVSLENTEFKVKLDREKAGDYMISRAGWQGDYQDPMTFFDLWITGGPFNDSRHEDPEYDKLIEEAKKSNDPKLRMENFRKCEKMMIDACTICPVYYQTQPYVVKPNVKGIFKTLTQYPNMKYAEIEQVNK